MPEKIEDIGRNRAASGPMSGRHPCKIKMLGGRAGLVARHEICRQYFCFVGTGFDRPEKDAKSSGGFAAELFMMEQKN
ncbi:MAG: hypothetical protein C4531_00155 [Desulfurivibrio sp.]|nr:MAG: hypothetical protein C4531_00155 [Desulfurivibrio sp.]